MGEGYRNLWAVGATDRAGSHLHNFFRRPGISGRARFLRQKPRFRNWAKPSFCADSEIQILRAAVPLDANEAMLKTSREVRICNGAPYRAGRRATAGFGYDSTSIDSDHSEIERQPVAASLGSSINVCFAPDCGRTADIQGGPVCANSGLRRNGYP